MNQTRELALTMLMEILEQGAYSHLLLRQTLDKYDYMDERDKAFVKRLTEGTLERLIEMDYILNQYSKVPVSKMKPLIRNLLRMSVYQLKYMDGVPDRAVCDEAVKLAGKRGFRGLQGFVNGILRNIARQKQQIPYPDPEKEKREYWSVKYSMPLWLTDFWLENYGEEKTCTILEGLLEEHFVTLRLRETLSDEEKERWLRTCKERDIVVEGHPYLPYAYRVADTAGIRKLPGYEEGLFAVQDVSSMLVAEITGVGRSPEEEESRRQKMLVLDVCAAPGGKAVHMAQKLADRGEVIARDISEQKISLIRENAERMQAANMKIQVWDALAFDEELREAADIVLADLPCSGLGIIGKKRDIKYRACREETEKLVQLQRQILSVIWQYVKPGGLLIYSTCTINPQENEKQVSWFLERYPFESESLVPYLPAELKDLPQAGSGMLQMFPGLQESDGFFLARLRRNSFTPDIKSLTLEELKTELIQMGEPAFRAKQLYGWMHVQLAESFEAMGNLPKTLRGKMQERFDYVTAALVQVQESAIDGTRKYLFEFEGGALVESVWMKYKHGNSVCISSQAGCRMGCRFCASTLDGLDRSLTPSEMLEQVYAITRLTGERVSNVVVMGTGEPLDNYENLLRFIRLLTDENGLHISQRNVTVSTCGLVPKMRELAEEGLQITLALSLHAPTDDMRRKIMPIAEKYSITELLDACRFYFERTGRRVTFEYALAEGVNDSRESAEQLSMLLRGMNCHVNLIPINPVRERSFRQSKTDAIAVFKNKLEKSGINVTIRREMGRDIDGACGQLRRRQKTSLQEV